MTNSIEKGKAGERALAKELRKHGFTEARRGAQYRGSPDSPDVVGVEGVHLECKRVGTLRIYDAVAQAHKDAAAGDVPVVAFLGNSRPHHQKPWLAILTLDDFLLIWRELDVARNVRAAPAALPAGPGSGDSTSKRMASAERW